MNTARIVVLTIAVGAGGVAAYLASGSDPQAPAQPTVQLQTVDVLVVAFACFAMGWVGGGDAKVAAGVALWFGFDHLLNYLIYASLFGGALTLLLLQFRQWPLPYPFAGQAWLNRLHDKQSGIPYGIALAIAALLVYPETEWIKAVDLTHFVR